MSAVPCFCSFPPERCPEANCLCRQTRLIKASVIRFCAKQMWGPKRPRLLREPEDSVEAGLLLHKPLRCNKTQELQSFPECKVLRTTSAQCFSAFLLLYSVSFLGCCLFLYWFPVVFWSRGLEEEKNCKGLTDEKRKKQPLLERDREF